MAKIYVAGPMRNRQLYNFPHFFAAAAKLRTHGWDVVNPAELDMESGCDPFDLPDNHDWSKEPDGKTFEEFMDRDLELLKECDAIFMLEGWQQSVGAVREYDCALERGLEIRYESSGMSAYHVMQAEKIVVNSSTGGRKGSKLARFDLIPARQLYALAEHYGKGCEKYEDRNWERGYDWSLSYAACQRHLNAFWNGEDIDGESGSYHVIAAAWHCLALAEFIETHPELDDRPSTVRDIALDANAEIEYDEWGALPDSARYVTRDPDGRRYWFNKEPRIVCGRWDEPDYNDTQWGPVPDTLTFPSIAEDIQPEWSDAIVERPDDWDRRIG